jgi:ribosomal protein S18 acetylase RimI-like enzyme
MMSQLTFIADLADILRGPAREIRGYPVRSTHRNDEEALSELYLAVYPEEIVKDLAEAREELRITFEGEYGLLDPEASPLALEGEKPVAVVLTVTEAPWPDTPRGPFIIEVMVDPEHRRKGLALYLIQETARRLVAAGKETVALRVMSENTGALRLYRSLGFRQWRGSGGGAKPLTEQ